MGNRAKRMRRDSIYELVFKRTQTITTPDGVDVQVPLVKGDLHSLPIKVQRFIAENVSGASFLGDRTLQQKYLQTLRMNLKTRDLAPTPKVLHCPSTTMHDHISGREEGLALVLTWLMARGWHLWGGG